MPDESGAEAEEFAPEDDLELSADLDLAFLDPWETTDFDPQAYDQALREERRGQRPLNLRSGTEETNCGNCTHYDPHTDQEGICGLFTYGVDADQLCDFWDAAN